MVLIGNARPETIQNFKFSHNLKFYYSLITAAFDITKLSYIKVPKPVITKYIYTPYKVKFTLEQATKAQR
jgi:hypothetical protein